MDASTSQAPSQDQASDNASASSSNEDDSPLLAPSMPATIPPGKIAITFQFEHKLIDLPASYAELLRAAYDKFGIDQAMRLDAWQVEVDATGRTVTSTHISEGLYYILEAGDRVIFNMINEPVSDVEDESENEQAPENGYQTPEATDSEG